MYSSDDPVGFISAFYGCLIAGIVPVTIDPPVSKDVSYLFVLERYQSEFIYSEFIW